jgi:hypothetical protein
MLTVSSTCSPSWIQPARTRVPLALASTRKSVVLLVRWASNSVSCPSNMKRAIQFVITLAKREVQECPIRARELDALSRSARAKEPRSDATAVAHARNQMATVRHNRDESSVILATLLVVMQLAEEAASRVEAPLEHLIGLRRPAGFG